MRLLWQKVLKTPDAALSSEIDGTLNCPIKSPALEDLTENISTDTNDTVSNNLFRFEFFIICTKVQGLKGVLKCINL